MFPLIRKGGGAPLSERISAMRSDHERHDRDLTTIRALTDDLALPAKACTPWATLYEELSTFMEDLPEHIRLENDILFPQFETEAHAKPRSLST